MPHKELSPESFTYQSYRHSQGNFSAQLIIFRYFEANFNLRPELTLTDKTKERYRKLLVSGGQKAHIQYSTSPNAELTANNAIWGNITRLKQIMNEKTGQDIAAYPVETVPGRLALTLASQELRILGADQPWLNNSGKDNGRLARLSHRIALGKTSFLFHYGRDGHTTSSVQFDQMYQDVWSHIVENQPDTEAPITISMNRLADAVQDAERDHPVVASH